jgi:hypothetical protein
MQSHILLAFQGNISSPSLGHIIWCLNPEDHDLHFLYHENLKSPMEMSMENMSFIYLFGF